MLRIRFRRVGLKRQPTYRIVVTDSRNSRDGGFLEIIGHHNPRTQPSVDVIDDARALHWLSVGAQPSEAAQRLMKRTGTWSRFERLRTGEAMETLVTEAKSAALEQNLNYKTSYPAPEAGKSKQKAKEAAAVAEAE